MKIGQQISKIRNEKGISQASMAQQLEISQSYVSGIEKGTRKCTLPMLLKICKVLDVSAVDFFSLEESYEDVDFNMVKTADLEDIGIEYIALAKEIKDKKIPLSAVKKIIEIFSELDK